MPLEERHLMILMQSLFAQRVMLNLGVLDILFSSRKNSKNRNLQSLGIVKELLEIKILDGLMEE